jgi:two-component system, NtrC family, sensor histidine kinase GlrK
VVIVTLALALTLTALVRISMALTTLNDVELVALRDEGILHGAAWALDVEARHARVTCEGGGSSEIVAARIREKTDALRPLAEEAALGRMRELALGYIATAEDILSGDACRNLLRAAVEARREELDEQLTNTWTDRLRELHAAVTAKEDQATRIAVSATWTGIPLAAAAFLLAMLIARRVARIVNQPLASLAMQAQDIGKGDFSGSIQVDGPQEILALAEALEHMRAELQQLDALKQGFLASVSHELRTPLSKIREALALLEDGAVGKSDPTEQRVIRIARSACEREIHLVTTLLNVSRLRAGSPVHLKDSAPVAQVVESAVRSEEAEALGGRVEIRTYVGDVDATCRMDVDLVERAVANLVRNAVAVSEPGQVVAVSASVEEARGGRLGPWVRVAVEDSGPGVPSEIRERVFNAFVTSRVVGSKKPVGIGLGLALAREVALAHGGDLLLAQTSPRGSTFELWLPLEEDRRRPSNIAPHRVGSP